MAAQPMTSSRGSIIGHKRSRDARHDQEFEENDNDLDPDFDARPLLWSDNTSGLKQIQFTKREGLLVPNPGNRPIDFFFLLLDIIFFENIVRKTNKYALELFCGPNTTPESTDGKTLPLKSSKSSWGCLSTQD
ncbi:hypothetical protein J6590_059718 [Homalodisca vitripennis]|nr:hypothetical protein J6590_059718 [Homalodisca vitripennis]